MSMFRLLVVMVVVLAVAVVGLSVTLSYFVAQNRSGSKAQALSLAEAMDLKKQLLVAKDALKTTETEHQRMLYNAGLYAYQVLALAYFASQTIPPDILVLFHSPATSDKTIIRLRVKHYDDNGRPTTSLHIEPLGVNTLYGGSYAFPRDGEVTIIR